MKDSGEVWYKCRFCGEEYVRYGVPDVDETLLYFSCGVKPDWLLIEMKITDFHSCGGGTMGISDLIGVTRRQ